MTKYRVIRIDEEHYLKLKKYALKNKRSLKASTEIIIDRVCL